MKKSILVLLFLAAVGALCGCVHPKDLDDITPAPAPAQAAPQN